MNAVYVDTSVLAAYYCPEPGSYLAEAALLAAGPVALSALTEVELASTVGRKVREGTLPLADGRQVLTLFAQHVRERRYLRVLLADSDYLLARDWLAQLTLSLRTLDALHLAAAVSREAALLTADRQLASCADALGLRCQFLDFAAAG